MDKESKTLEIMTDAEYESVKAFDQGMEARQSDSKNSDCPYEIDTRKRKEWVNGYEVMILSEADLGGEDG